MDGGTNKVHERIQRTFFNEIVNATINCIIDIGVY